MMKLIFSSCGLQFVLTVSVYFTLSTSSTKECELQLTETTKSRSVVLRSIDMKLCQTECFQDSFILAYCRRSSDEFRRTEATEVYSVRPENQTSVLPKHCGSKVCSVTSQCVEGGCGTVYVESLPPCNLYTASKTGDLDVVKYILCLNSVDINIRGNRRKTPVMAAAAYGHKEIVELLVEHGADLSLREKSGSNILHNACYSGQFDVVKYILSQTSVDINSWGYIKKTPAMLAAAYGHKEVVELLVQHGADLSLREKSGSNILHNACSRGQFDVVKYVLSLNSVDINSRGYKKRTPVMAAAEQGHKEVVELLVNNEADLSLRDDDGKNFLNLARQGGHVEVVKLAMSL